MTYWKRVPEVLNERLRKMAEILDQARDVLLPVEPTTSLGEVG